MSAHKEYPGKLHHEVPAWVAPGSPFHIRIRTHVDFNEDLTASALVEPILNSVRFYHERRTWHARLFLLMPDHIHAILSFPQGKSMSDVVGAWKGYQAKSLGVSWQLGFFDHRLRNEASLVEKVDYIRMNPVRAGLCESPEDWPWVFEPDAGM